jgi:hypothetical protein
MPAGSFGFIRPSPGIPLANYYSTTDGRLHIQGTDGVISAANCLVLRFINMVTHLVEKQPWQMD